MFELTDELLDRALAVQSAPLPADLRERVHAAVAEAARNGRPRPFARVLTFASVTTVALVVLFGVMAYVGSRPPTITPPPMFATPTPSAPPTPRVVVPTPAPDAQIVSQAEFLAHVSDSIERFRPLSSAFTSWINTFNGLDFGQPQEIGLEWIPAEQHWIAGHLPEPCFAPLFDAWVDAGNLLWQEPSGTPSVQEQRAAWTLARDAIENFDLTPTDSCGAIPSTTPAVTASPAPLPTASSDVPATTFADFSAHVADSVTVFADAAPHWFTCARTLDDCGAAQKFEQWMPDEIAWVRAHRPEPCYFTPFAHWVRAVTDMEWAKRHAGTPLGEPNPNFPGMWAIASQTILTFDTGKDGACPKVVTFQEFTAHIATAAASFGPAAEGLYAFVKYLDYGGSGPDALRGKWLPSESRWLNFNKPEACFQASYDAWKTAVGDMRSASEFLQPFGGLTEEREARFLSARNGINSFDPAALARCS